MIVSLIIFISIGIFCPKSFEGFTIDDFNWISTRSDTKFKNNVDFMEDTELSIELRHKTKM
jgi:hypothetical protein